MQMESIQAQATGATTLWAYIRPVPKKGTGKRKCFECKQFTDHIADKCPQRLSRREGQGNDRSRYANMINRNSYSGGRRGRRSYRGNKRGNESGEYYPKRKRQI